MKIYFSSGFVSMYVLEELAEVLRNRYRIDDEFIIPNLIEAKYHEYVFSDIKSLHEADMMIIHLPQPSIGAAAELGYFKAIKPYAPVISYRSMDHGWLERLTIKIDEPLDVANFIMTLKLSKRGKQI